MKWRPIDCAVIRTCVSTCRGAGVADSGGGAAVGIRETWTTSTVSSGSNEFAPGRFGSPKSRARYSITTVVKRTLIDARILPDAPPVRQGGEQLLSASTDAALAALHDELAQRSADVERV